MCILARLLPWMPGCQNDISERFQVKSMDSDEQLGVAQMPNDVKLIFRSGQAAGVPCAVLQRAAERFARVMAERRPGS